ncbi:MAG TPA: ABC transporter ATP-binding protein [Acidimicrobiales bacterium]|nr:ABC transporter ATP-binding protein [Acidimicrobiales bacterium]
MRAAVAYTVTRGVDGVLRARAMEAANRSPGIAMLEDPAMLDRLALAGGHIDNFWDASPGGAAVALVSVGGRYLQVAGATVLVARVSVPIAVVLATVLVMAYRQCRRWDRVRIGAVRASQAGGRASRYTSGLANTPPSAKEVRLFGLLEWLVARFRGQWDALVSARLAAGRWAISRMVALILGLTPVAVAAFVVLARRGLDGATGARGLTVALQAVVAMFVLLDQRSDDGYQLDFGLESLAALREVEAGVGDATSAGGGSDAAGLPVTAIRFEEVDFAYPGGREILKGLDLTIAAGSSLAIVGGNGAGKTTLVKLLAGLYEPDAGAITVDGIPLRTFDVASWRRRLAVIFQDFVRYELSAADNVGLAGVGGHPEREHRADALDTAAARAGAFDVVARLPLGWQTPLGRQYAGGADLSGGEWQRIALARALFAVESGAGVLVLDEPTANLDVRAEAELFDRFLELTTGLTTILISHRFSTVRRADRICVLEHGRVVEDGSHEELVAADGRYCQLFQLQATRFRD